MAQRVAGTCRRRRFLERLQQRVCRRGGHGVGRLDDHHLRPADESLEAQLGAEPANLLDRDRSLVLLREQTNADRGDGRPECVDPRTRRRASLGSKIRRVLARAAPRASRSREDEREIELAETRPAPLSARRGQDAVPRMRSRAARGARGATGTSVAFSVASARLGHFPNVCREASSSRTMAACTAASAPAASIDLDSLRVALRPLEVGARARARRMARASRSK